MPSPSGSTAKYGLPYLLETDAPDVATASQDLAQGVENILATAYQGLASAIPVAGKSGRLYYATDTFTLYYDNGSSWVRINRNVTYLDYNPAGNTNYGGISATVMTLLDPTNLSITFVAPASGIVLWQWQCACLMDTAGVALSFQPYNVTTSAYVGHAQIATEATNTERITVTDAITGLTPGTSYTLTPGYNVAGHTASLYGGGAQGGYLQIVTGV